MSEEDFPPILDPDLESLEQLAFELEEKSSPEEKTGGKEEEKKKSKPPDYHKHLLALKRDFDSFRDRVAREKETWEGRGVDKAILTILPVLDHLELALSHSREKKIDPQFLEGISLIRNQFLKALQQLGVEKIKTEGEVFDPHSHEAVSVVPSGRYPEGSVVTEVRAGYQRRERVIRPAKVTVAGTASKESSER